MCFTIEQAEAIVKEYKLDDLVDWIAEGAGAMFDYGPDDYTDKKKRDEVVAGALRGLADMIVNGVLVKAQ